MKLFKITILSLLTVSLLSNTATAACYNNIRPWGQIFHISGRTFWAHTTDEDRYPYIWINSFMVVYRGGYTSTKTKIKGTAPFNLTKGLNQIYAEDFTTCGPTGNYWWFADVQVQ